jgi:hypothetical protein
MKPLEISIILFTFCANVNSLALAAEPYKIALSEIQMLPAHTNDPVRIELVNRSGESVDMTGWYMTDGYGHRYDFPKALTVPKGALVVVSFGSKPEKDKDDLDFSDNVAYLYCKESWADKAFRHRKNECAVYAPAKDGEKNGNVHDYILWGSRTKEEILNRTDAFKQAVEKKIWYEEDAAITPDENSIGGRHIQAGESLARIDFQRQWLMSTAWFINAPGDVSLGMINSWPAPCPMYPRNKEGSELIKTQPFGWDATCGTNDTFLFQLSKNIDFTALLLEKVTPEHSIRHTIEEGTYYWRVCINAPETERKWSRIMEFTKFDMAKRRSWQPGDPRIRFKGKNFEDKEPKPVQ